MQRMPINFQEPLSEIGCIVISLLFKNKLKEAFKIGIRPQALGSRV